MKILFISKLVYILCLFTIWCRAYVVNKLTNYLLHGESPHWNAESQKLYFVDSSNNTIHMYDPIREEHQMVAIAGGSISFIIPISGKKDEFLVSTGLDIRHVTWNGSSNDKPRSYILYSAKQISDGSRLSGAKVDRTGRLWAGTMGPEVSPDVVLKKTGKLYSITPHTGLVEHLKDILISNGLSWTIDNSKMFYTDTGKNAIESFEFNELEILPISNHNTVYNFTTEKITGKTGGITIDRNGNLWLATFTGSQILQVNPNGRLVQRIPIPALKVTSLVWGGPNLDLLYVTTSRKGANNLELQRYPFSGATFVISGLGNAGYPSDNYRHYV